MTGKAYLLFDLDGTITDPKAGITKSVQYSLRSFGINIENIDDLIRFIGPPLRTSFKDFYGMDDAQAEKAVEKYREYFSETGIFENTLYDGMDDLLQKQLVTGKRLILATSKPAVYAEQILRHFDIYKYFSFVSGSELDGRRSIKREVIQHALNSMCITDTRQAVMIGDREHDIIGANETGMDSIGVLYGYGDLRELTSAGATHIAESIDGLAKLLG